MHGTPCVNESVRQLVVVNAQVGRRQTTVSQGGVSHIRGGIAWGEKGEKERGKRGKKKIESGQCTKFPIDFFFPR